mgnify:CR=1 FL=1
MMQQSFPVPPQAQVLVTENNRLVLQTVHSRNPIFKLILELLIINIEIANTFIVRYYSY